MIIENVLARIEILERELSAALDRLDTLEKRGPITTQATSAATPTPAPASATVKISTPTATTKSTAK